MRTLTYAFAVAALSSLALGAGPTSASPLASGLGSGNAAIPEVSDGLVQKVHGWHCRRRFGWYRGDKYWHRHRRACHYGYHPYYGGPVVSFGLFFDDDDRDRRRHRRYKKKSY